MQGWFLRLRRSWFDLALVRKGAIIVSIPLACILFLVATIVVFQQQRAQLTEWIARAFEASAGISDAIALVTSAESQTRASLLTSDPRYLEGIRKAESGVDRELDRVRRNTEDTPSQKERLDRVGSLIRERVARLRALSTEDPGSLPQQIGEGQKLTEAIEREFRAIRDEESRSWAVRMAAEQQLLSRLSTVTYGSAVLSLFAGSVAMMLFLSGISGRAELLRENADRLARGEPVSQLSGGADELGRAGDALTRSSDRSMERERDLRRLNDELEARVRERTAALDRETAGRRTIEEQLRESQKMDAIGRLAGGIAHDFNNVLAVVIGFGQSLARSVAHDPEAKADLHEILGAADHATTLTRQLLAFSRRQVLQPKQIHLNDVVLRTEKLLRRVVGEDIELRTICPPMRETVLLDEGQLEQVIMNLVVNARDAMPHGGKLWIQTDLLDFDRGYCDEHLGAKPGLHVMLAVRDSGRGMTPEVQARIFEPFFTTKEAGKGTGLGLATVYGIVKQSGGHIWVYSEPGMGTTFKIYFPVGEAPGQPAVKEAQVEPTLAKAITILVVEDEPSVRRMTKQVLERYGHTVLEADGAEAAIELCREHGPKIDLLLTDVVMPKTNGRELARGLVSEYPRMRVLYMSGYTDETVGAHFILEPSAWLIEKPFSPATLAQTIAKVMA